jgi:hypothetical protein
VSERLPTSDDPLDDLLQQARWADMRPAEQRLRTQLRRDDQFRWMARAAIAAVVAVVGLVGWRLVRHASIKLPEKAVATINAPVRSRPATAYERLFVPAVAKISTKRTTVLPREKLVRLLADLQAGRSADAVALDLQQLPSRVYVWRVLMAHASNVELEKPLAELASLYVRPGEVRQLSPWLNREKTREIVADRYVQLCSTTDLLRSREWIGDRRLVAGLVARDGEGIAALLSLSGDREIRSAMSVLSNPPIAELSRAALSGDAPTRASAMRLLGSIDSGSAALAALVQRDIRRREALDALVSSDSRASREYLEQFSQSRQLASEIKILQEQQELQ